MNSTNKVLMIIIGTVVLTGTVLYFIKPKATITLRKDGTGNIKLGNSTQEFSVGTGADLTSWNGYELHIFGEKIWFRKWGRDLVKTDGTPDVEIVAI